MAGNVVKSIVLLMVLVVLSAVIGSQISDSLSQSYGAFIVIGAVVTIFGMLLWADKCWWLVYILPAMAVGSMLVIGQKPLAFSLSTGVLVCSVVMWLVGHLKFTWHSAPLLDAAVFLLTSIFVVSYIRFPVSVNAFGFEYEYVGGKEYVWMICALMHYIAISVLTPASGNVPRVIKWSMWLMMLVQVPLCTHAYVTRSAYVEEGLVLSRYVMFYYGSSSLIYFAYAMLPIDKMLTSVRALVMLITGVFFLLLCGGREFFLRCAASSVFLAFLKRELSMAIFIAVFVYGIVYILGTGHMWNDAPYAMQRILTVLPGVEVSREAQMETAGSSATRQAIWSLGLDPHSGLIKDYVWGDGFQLSQSALQRDMVAGMRGIKRDDEGERKGFGWAYQLAETNNWHNGWLTAIKRCGFVGLGTVNLFFLAGLFTLAKVSNAYRGTKEYPYIMVMCLPFASVALTFVIGTQTFVDVFDTFVPLGYIKMLYCSARAQGRIAPLFMRAAYVPLVIREQTEGATH